MIDPAVNDWSLTLLEQAARFAEKRQSVLAGNVANINTPNYKVRDLPVGEFRQAMSDAVAQRKAPPSLGHVPPEPGNISEDLFKAREVASGHLTFQDGGNRNLEHEMTELTKNAMQHRVTVEMLASRLRLLETVISGRL